MNQFLKPKHIEQGIIYGLLSFSVILDFLLTIYGLQIDGVIETNLLYQITQSYFTMFLTGFLIIGIILYTTHKTEIERLLYIIILVKMYAVINNIIVITGVN